MTWERITIPSRPDIIGVRQTSHGRQFLLHNAALCQPYYTANELQKEPQ